MAHKTFISYKYSESQDLRDRIIDSLGKDSKFYQGETSDSPDLTDTTTDTIRTHLKEMIFSTSVMIVILSPHMKESKWMDWEIKYALKDISHEGSQSHSNGILGIIKNSPDASWLKSKITKEDGHINCIYDNSKVLDIINKNTINQVPRVYACKQCKSIDALYGNYITYVEENDFFSDPNKYIENAYDKSQKISKYDIKKQ